MDMNKPLVEQEIGPEAKMRVQFEDGSLEISVDYAGKLGGAGMYLKAEAVKVIDAITDAIPGEMDDAIIDSMAKKLLSKKTGA